ncbi:MAG: ABC transporter permease [Burkholderiales bacterium]|nr:ABC transporter permease [Anaerolineae bacterium]
MTTVTAPNRRSMSETFARTRRLPAPLLAGSIILIFYLVIALTGRFWAPYDFAKTSTGRPFTPPGVEHLFGTDQLGRDIFSRVVHGTDDVLFLSLTSTLLSTFIGGTLGLLSGFIGGWFDQLLMRLFDAMISIPFIVLALLIIAAAGPENSGSYPLLIMVVAVVYAPRTARMARAVAIDLVTRDFVTVARSRGESAWSIVRRELTPNALGVLLVEFGVRAGYAPIFIGSLSFLGFGVRPPIPEWGLMISENRSAIISAPASVFAPAIALAVLVIGLNLFTDGLSRVYGRANTQ